MTNAARPRPRWPLLMLVLIAVGCSSDDERLVDLSRQSLDRQTEQNRLVEANNRQVIDATQRLVEADAQARRENIQLHREIQTERSGINQQRDALEQERRQIADTRNRDPIVAESIQSAVGLIVAALPLVVCLFVLRGLFHKSDDEAMADVLVEELVTQQPLLADPESRLLPSQAPSESLPSPVAPPRIGLSQDRSIPAEATQNSSVGGILVVVEGTHDVEFLRRISRMLNDHDPAIPNLNRLELDGRLTFLTADTGGLPAASTTLGQQFHVYDREMPPVTDERRRLIEFLNRRANCRAVLTSKRAIENYLHPDAICEAGGVQVSFGDFDDVAEIIAQACLRTDDSRPWKGLSRRARRRLRDKAKRWLNREAVDRMSPERLAERDLNREVAGWLRTIAELANARCGAAA
jgi:hypothetical protein